MAHCKPEEDLSKPGQDISELDEAFHEQLRNDPSVIVHERKVRKPFVSELRVTPGLDILELIGHRDTRSTSSESHDSPIPETDEEWLEHLRNDPEVEYYHRTGEIPPFTGTQVTEGLDVLKLIGRPEDDDVESSRRGSTERRVEMAQRKPEEELFKPEQAIPEMDEEFREKLRNDPNVIVHRQTTTEPYVPKITLIEPVDELWLIGRREREWEDDETPAIDE